tara:strand:+ start:252 stop:407 length:156 start_codon:yes stop_codon:yes gene_type:complete
MGNLLACSDFCPPPQDIGTVYDPRECEGMIRAHEYAILREPLAPESIDMLI